MPDLQDRWSEFQHLKTETYAALRKRQKEHDDLYWQTADIGLTSYFGTPIWRPSAMRIIEAPADHIAMDKIVVNCPPRLGGRGVETKGTQQEADKKEKGLQWVLDEQRKQEPYFLRELVKSLSWHGEGYLKVQFDIEAMKHPKDWSGCPFTFEVPNARQVYSTLDMEKAVPFLIYEEKVVSLSLVKRRLEEWNQDKEIIRSVLEGFESQHLKDSQLISFVEWWTPEERGYMVGNFEGKPLSAIPISNDFVVPNNFGWVPYARGFSGRGIMPDDGDPARIAVGLLTGLEKTIILQARLCTQINTMTSTHAAPNWIATLGPGYVPTDKDSLMEPGIIKEQQQGHIEKWELVNPPPIPPNLLQEMQLVDATLEEYLPSVTRGAETPGEPASSSANRYSWASLIWEPELICVRRLIGVVLGMCLKTIELIKAPIELTPGLSLGPDDIKGNYDVTVSIESGNPEQKRYDYLLGNDMKGKLPDELIIEKFYHEPDASGIMAKLLAQQFLQVLMMGGQLNDYQRKVAQDVFEKIGLETQLAASPPAQGVAPMPPAPQGGVEGPPGIGGSPTRGVSPMASGPSPESPEMRRLRIAEEGLRGLR